MSTRAFVGGLVACIAVMLALGGALFVLNHGHHRPEGAAEHWLSALSDTTRKGVEEDATERTAKLGDPTLGKELVHPDAEAIDRKGAFGDLEVGKALVDGDKSRVGFRVHARRPNDTTKAVNGVITLTRDADDEWTVTAVDVGDPVKAGVPELPSEGGPPPSSAPWSLWVGALVGALIIGIITTGLVRASGAASPSPAAA